MPVDTDGVVGDVLDPRDPAVVRDVVRLCVQDPANKRQFQGYFNESLIVSNEQKENLRQGT